MQHLRLPRTHSLLRNWLIGIFLLGAAAGANAADDFSILAGFEDSPTATRFNLVDERPKDEKKKAIGSVLITSCSYGVQRIPDDATTPDRLRLLRSDLDFATGGFLNNKTIRVKHYTIHANLGAELRSGIDGKSPLPLIAYTQAREAKCPASKMEGGWFAASEITNSFSPLIAVLTVDIDGRLYTSRAVISPSAFYRPWSTYEAFNKALFEIMHNVANNLAGKLPTR